MSYEYVDEEQKIILTEQNGNKIEYIHDDAFRSSKKAKISFKKTDA
ncbi:hypothetical protein IA817_11290 [Listeria seeligeri]|nr:hypothetical protein [Listeria seeligeri]MBF2481897.1 hypothetical protein [Listeria seeligeri]